MGLLQWREARLQQPGKPTDDAVNESFSGRLHDENLNQHLFLPRDEAREVKKGMKAGL